jgi:hypothetical protein
VIEDFLLTEANKQLQTPYERYQSAFAEFMSEMDAWQSAANEAQVRPTMEQLSIDDRRRQLDTPNGSSEVPAARINSLMEGFSIRMGSQAIHRYFTFSDRQHWTSKTYR